MNINFKSKENRDIYKYLDQGIDILYMLNEIETELNTSFFTKKSNDIPEIKNILKTYNKTLNKSILRLKKFSNSDNESIKAFNPELIDSFEKMIESNIEIIKTDYKTKEDFEIDFAMQYTAQSFLKIGLPISYESICLSTIEEFKSKIKLEKARNKKICHSSITQKQKDNLKKTLRSRFPEKIFSFNIDEVSIQYLKTVLKIDKFLNSKYVVFK